MKKVIKKNYKFILGIIIGLVWSSGIAYAATILFESSEVSYDNTTSGLSATNVQSALDELYVESTSYQLFESRVSTLESQIYPVGSIYISTTKTTASQVASLFGGKWVSFGAGRVLLGMGSNGTTNYATVEATGGSETNTHSHSHASPVTTVTGVPGSFVVGSGNHVASETISIMQPYITVYMYKRTA